MRIHINMRHESSTFGTLILALATSARYCSCFGPSSSYGRSHVPQTISCSTRLHLSFNPFSRRSLREECEERYPSSFWADDVTEGYQVAAKVFDTMLNISSNVEDTQYIWLPKMKSREATQMLSGLIDCLNANGVRLGGWSASLETWPISPTTGIVLYGAGRTDAPRPVHSNEGEHTQNAIDETELWVNNTLGRLRLCPYTTSMSRAAIGLDSVGVSSGPVIVRHTVPLSLSDGNDENGIAPTDAVMLGASFWNAVIDLAHCPETEVATFLLVAPSSYDENFAEFISTCDNLLEGSCKAVGADGIIGKAWFHPNYNSTVVGQDSILPGHALPAKMVKTFVDQYFDDMDGLDLSAVMRANDAVRHTPHATVNLLRRSQLRASKEAEAASLSSVKSKAKEGRQKRRVGPNSIYAQNVHTLHRLLSLEDDG